VSATCRRVQKQGDGLAQWPKKAGPPGHVPAAWNGSHSLHLPLSQTLVVPVTWTMARPLGWNALGGSGSDGLLVECLLVPRRRGALGDGLGEAVGDEFGYRRDERGGY